MTVLAINPAFLDALGKAASSAHTAEMEFRNNIGREIARLERARQFAFRRLELARQMAAAAGRAEGEEKAVAAQLATLRSEFGWHGDNEHNRKVLDAWRPVAVAVWQEISCNDDGAAAGPGVAEALRDFEAWYDATFGRNYLSILDHEIPEIPVVEF